MERLRGMTLEGFMGELASPRPTPGGGSAAAVAGAMAAALVAMVTSISLGKSPGDPDLSGARSRAEELRGALLELADRDAAAYEEVVEALRLPKGTEDRGTRIQEALRAAAEVPLETARLAAGVLEAAARAAKAVKPAVLSDLLVAARLAHAGVHAALYNVDVNRASLKEEGIRGDLGRKRAEIADRADGLLRELLALEEGLCGP